MPSIAGDSMATRPTRAVWWGTPTRVSSLPIMVGLLTLTLTPSSPPIAGITDINLQPSLIAGITTLTLTHREASSLRRGCTTHREASCLRRGCTYHGRTGSTLRRRMHSWENREYSAQTDALRCITVVYTSRMPLRCITVVYTHQDASLCVYNSGVYPPGAS